MGLGRRKRAEVCDNLEGEMSKRRNRGAEEERCGYVLGIGAGYKLVCCTQRRRGQLEFSSDRPPEYLSPQAGGLVEHQRHKVMLWRQRYKILAALCLKIV